VQTFHLAATPSWKLMDDEKVPSGGEGGGGGASIYQRCVGKKLDILVVGKGEAPTHHTCSPSYFFFRARKSHFLSSESSLFHFSRLSRRGRKARRPAFHLWRFLVERPLISHAFDELNKNYFLFSSTSFKPSPSFAFAFPHLHFSREILTSPEGKKKETKKKAEEAFSSLFRGGSPENGCHLFRERRRLYFLPPEDGNVRNTLNERNFACFSRHLSRNSLFFPPSSRSRPLLRLDSGLQGRRNARLNA